MMKFSVVHTMVIYSILIIILNWSVVGAANGLCVFNDQYAVTERVQ